MVGEGRRNNDDDDDAMTVYCVAPVIAFPSIIIISTFRFATVLGTAGYVCPAGHPRVVEPADDLSAE